MTVKRKSYSELITIPSFKERYEYLKLDGKLGDETFGSKRHLNQVFYKSHDWLEARRRAIVRDMGLDMAFPDRLIRGSILVHHINPITEEDILSYSYNLFDLENLICVSKLTHNAIHYGSLENDDYVPRKPNDTCPWLQ